MRVLALLLLCLGLASAPLTVSAVGPCQMAAMSDCMAKNCTCGSERRSDNMLACASACVAACAAVALPECADGELAPAPRDIERPPAINGDLRHKPALDPPIPR